MKKRLLSVAIVFALFGMVLWALSHVPRGEYAEAETIGKDAKSFQELSDRFADLANEKGAVYAFEILRRADLPYNTDIHLLGHEIGNELYKQKNVDGIADCTQDFRNACSHAIVIGTLGEYGNAALEQIRTACHEAPGGPGAYTMCFHGLGHGVLAFNEYDFSKTQEFCELTGTKEYQNREYSECMGGAVMEIISGGGHDIETWGAQRRIYLSKDEPLALCQETFFDETTRSICYDYVTPFLFEAAGADLGFPQPEDYERGFEFCSTLSSGSTERESCYGGFGKEFIVLARYRDVRAIEHMTAEQVQRVHDWCALAHDTEGTRACVLSAMQSAYWGGENTPDTAILLCSLAVEAHRESCFSGLTEAVLTYIEDNAYRENFCAIIPPEFQDGCRGELL